MNVQEWARTPLHTQKFDSTLDFMTSSEVSRNVLSITRQVNVENIAKLSKILRKLALKQTCRKQEHKRVRSGDAFARTGTFSGWGSIAMAQRTHADRACTQQQSIISNDSVRCEPSHSPGQ